MLKYQVNIKKLFSDRFVLPVTEIQCYTYGLSDIAETMDVECKYTQNINLTINDVVILKITNTHSGSDEYFTKEINVSEINSRDNYFILRMPHYINLKIASIEEKKEVNSNEDVKNPLWWYIKFAEKHFFNEFDEINLAIEYYNSDNILETLYLNNCQYVNTTTVKYNLNTTKDEEVNCGNNIFYEQPDGENFARGLGNTLRIRSICREHLIITKDISDIKIYSKKHRLGVNLPFENTNRTDLLNQFFIDEKFVETETKKVINTPVEMEKILFTPIYCNENNEEEIYKINFNLHLRKHSGDDWITTDNDYWNGIKKEDDILMLDEDFFSEPYKENNKKISWQSDNLNLLGFNNADVKYQKSRLKKTFLRLSFYDSPYITNQNLVGYSTIFLDSNKLFTRLTKNLKTTNYKIPNYDGVFTGIGVNKEIGENFKNFKKQSVTIDDVENYRLSSQFSVEDRFNSNDSSEGFYVYLWKDYVQGTEPKDLYLHIDLNHAIFGRSIPLMMPYFGVKKNEEWDGTAEGSWINNNKGIKSFQDILRDWQEDAGGYTMQRYLRYSFIHLKCKFDDSKNRYVYYLDNEHYGNNLNNIYDDKNNILNFILYEAKISGGKMLDNSNSDDTTETYEDINVILKDFNYNELTNKSISIDNVGGSRTVRMFAFLKYKKDGIDKYKANENIVLGYKVTLNTTDGLWVIASKSGSVDDKTYTKQDIFYKNTKVKFYSKITNDLFKIKVNNEITIYCDSNFTKCYDYNEKTNYIKESNEYQITIEDETVTIKKNTVPCGKFICDNDGYIYDIKNDNKYKLSGMKTITIKNESDEIIGYKYSNGTPCDKNGFVYKTTYYTNYNEIKNLKYYRVFDKSSDDSGKYEYVDGTECDENGNVDGQKLFILDTTHTGLYNYNGILCDENGYVCEMDINYDFTELNKQKTNTIKNCSVIDSEFIAQFTDKSKFKVMKKNEIVEFKQELAPKTSESVSETDVALVVDNPNRSFTISQTTNEIIEESIIFDINALNNGVKGENAFSYEVINYDYVLNETNEKYKLYGEDGVTQLTVNGNATDGYYYEVNGIKITCDEDGYVIKIYNNLFCKPQDFQFEKCLPLNGFDYNTGLKITNKFTKEQINEFKSWKILHIKVSLNNSNEEPQFIKLVIIPSETLNVNVDYIIDEEITPTLYKKDGEVYIEISSDELYSYKQDTEMRCVFGYYLIPPYISNGVVNYDLKTKLIDKENIKYEFNQNICSSSLTVNQTDNVYNLDVILNKNVSSSKELEDGKEYKLTITNGLLTTNNKQVIEFKQAIDFITYTYQLYKDETLINQDSVALDFGYMLVENASNNSFSIKSFAQHSMSNKLEMIDINIDESDYFEIKKDKQFDTKQYDLEINIKEDNESYMEREETIKITQENYQDDDNINREKGVFEFTLTQEKDISKKYNFFNFWK